MGDAPHFSLSGARLGPLLRPNLSAPVFVVGAPRTGTTFLGGCLAAVPGLSYHYEPYVLQNATRMYLAGEWDEARTQRFLRRTYRWLLRLRLAGSARLVDKTPSHVFVMDLLAATFPDARFLVATRDGRDVAVSLAERSWLRGVWAAARQRYPSGELQGPFAPYFIEPERREEFERTSDLHRAIWVWRRHTEAGLAAADRLGADRCLEVRYESLLTDPSGQADRIATFLGLDAPVQRHPFVEEVQAIRGTSAGRWREQLGTQGLEVVEREAGPLLEQLGYV
jgi:LPS sulfotransferase NodH